jgi:hypothetical protein
MVEVLIDFGVAAGAAVAGAGDAANLFHRAKLESLDGVDELAFGDLQTTANHAIGTFEASVEGAHGRTWRVGRRY